MKTREELELEVVMAFEFKVNERRTYSLSDNDGRKDLIHLAYKAFRGNSESFKRWLREGSVQGTPKPIDLLLNEEHGGRSWKDYWVVKEALLKMLLERHGLTVPRPEVELNYVRVARTGKSGETFFVFRHKDKVEEVSS